MSHVDAQGRRVGDCGHYLREIGPLVYRCDECERQADTVTIPRAQHEALMAAAKALKHITSLSYGYQGRTVAEEALAALRASGILEGK